MFDFRVTEIAGQPRLSHHQKEAYILNQSYEVEKVVPLVTRPDDVADMHSFHVVDGGTHALTIKNRPWNTSRYLGKVDFYGSCFAGYQGFSA